MPISLASLRRPSIAAYLIIITGLLRAQTPCEVGAIAGQDCGPRLNTITTAVPFRMIGPDSRAGGMGDAGVAIDPDVNALHWNPSKLAFAEDEGGVTLSFSPWLRNLVPDMSLAYLAGYTKLANKRSAIGGSLRYFNNGQPIKEFQPTEFAVDVSFAQQFSDFFSGGLSIRYVNSNLTGGIGVQGADSRAGQSVAADVSFYFRKPQLRLGDKDGVFAFGADISNIGAKMSYTTTSERDFIPINLRIGPALMVDLDEYNSIGINIDFNKLLVPTPPQYSTKIDPTTNKYEIVSGSNPDVGIVEGIFNSFSDAPGIVYYDTDSVPHVVSGSKVKEEWREINMAGGFEYWYAKQFAFRGGYFWEHRYKGARQYATLGLGVRFSIFEIDLSYLIANTQRSPLANTLRFSLGFRFSKDSKKKDQVE